MYINEITRTMKGVKINNVEWTKASNGSQMVAVRPLPERPWYVVKIFSSVWNPQKEEWTMKEVQDLHASVHTKFPSELNNLFQLAVAGW